MVYLVDRGTVRAPAFAADNWLNTPRPLALENLRGRVTLINIWDYSCGDCLRALPYLRQWWSRYARLTVIGVHTPRFDFGHERALVELATQEFNIGYPILLDNDFKTWNAYHNQVWPTKYLIDRDGYIRYHQPGYGDYAEFEQALQALLREADPNTDLPLIQPSADEASTSLTSLSLDAGFQGGALGNPEGYAGIAPILYRLPAHRAEGAFYLDGAWQASKRYLVYQGRAEGRIQVPYSATEVHAVLAPHVETVERMLHPRTVQVEIWQDEQPLDPARAGADMTTDGRIPVDRPRLYHLVRNPGFEAHELTLRVTEPGFGFYGFSFVGGDTP